MPERYAQLLQSIREKMHERSDRRHIRNRYTNLLTAPRQVANAHLW